MTAFVDGDGDVKKLRSKGVGRETNVEMLVQVLCERRVFEATQVVDADLSVLSSRHAWHMSGKRKAHKREFFGPVALGTTPGLSQERTRFAPGTKLSLSLGQTQVFSLVDPVEAQFVQEQAHFVPGTNPCSLS